MLGKILCATDLTEGSDAALALALDLGRRYDAEVELLYVVESVSSSHHHHDLGREVARHEERTSITRMMEAVTRHQPHARTRMWVRHGHPAEVAVHMAVELKVDLIVVGTHGRTGLARALLGSVAEKISRTAPCPVLLARPPATP